MNLSKEQKRLKQNGVRCLRGGTVHLVAGVSLVGMEDYMIAPHAQFPQAEPDAFTSAMEHEPLRIEQAASRGMNALLRRAHACRTVLPTGS